MCNKGNNESKILLSQNIIPIAESVLYLKEIDSMEKMFLANVSC